MKTAIKNVRIVEGVLSGRPATDGAGVRLNRIFGFNEVPLLDPFLLLDDFHSDNPTDYIAGFPWHPHRGIETVTYMIQGMVKHEDSLKNSGVIESGDVQWMTAGSGIIHQEMPVQKEGELHGLQLWVNLPASQKMMPPRYREVKAVDIPVVELDHGIRAKVIAGKIGSTEGPVKKIMPHPTYLDVNIPAEEIFHHDLAEDHRVLAYILDGEGFFDPDTRRVTKKGQLVFFQNGTSVRIRAGNRGVRFLLLSGKPLGEPVAWQGPVVMNTEEELELAFREYRDGNFLK